MAHGWRQDAAHVGDNSKIIKGGISTMRQALATTTSRCDEGRNGYFVIFGRHVWGKKWQSMRLARFIFTVA
jgi:hypothetical protein